MRKWVLLAYRLPREPSTPRIAVWRSLRRLGAAQVGDGLVVLPRTDETLEQFEWLAEDIRASGGESSVWLSEATTRAQEGHWVGRIVAASDDEYAALQQRAADGAALEPSDRRRALRQLRAEYRRVRARDFFHAPAGEAAEAAIERLAERDRVAAR